MLAHAFLSWALMLHTVHALDNGLGLKGPAMGWSSWNHFRDRISASLLREVADAMVSSGLRDAGYTYLNIDDGWQARKRNETTHRLVPDPTKFPEGMAALAEYVHGKGLKLGIYTSRGDHTCLGRPGSRGYEALDAATFAEWGIE